VWALFTAISWWEQVTFQWDDDVCFVLDQQALLNIHSASSQVTDKFYHIRFASKHLAKREAKLTNLSEFCFPLLTSCVGKSNYHTRVNCILYLHQEVQSKKWCRKMHLYKFYKTDLFHNSDCLCSYYSLFVGHWHILMILKGFPP
jgi:hypothetical protein